MTGAAMSDMAAPVHTQCQYSNELRIECLSLLSFKSVGSFNTLNYPHVTIYGVLAVRNGFLQIVADRNN
ncbi:hypothetical protein EDF68_11814 [Ochrobactrum sp. BH3]|nr:hypothetical protein EDF68_11814 [Ochrobactrum sp. BH3]